MPSEWTKPMNGGPQSCPTCAREFHSILDYPLVRVIAFERLPIPESVDTLSGAAAERIAARRSKDRGNEFAPLRGGINMTPAIRRACDTPAVQEYFEQLSQSVGQELSPRRLLPGLAPHGRFRWTYPVADTGIYLSLGESETAPEHGRAAEVQVHCAGPNLGSAGGPTLQFLGAVARLEYEGLLKS